MSSSITSTRFSSTSYQSEASTPVLSANVALDSLDTAQKAQSVYETLSSLIQQEHKELSKLEEKFKVGDELKVKVVKVDSATHKIALSLKV